VLRNEKEAFISSVKNELASKEALVLLHHSKLKFGALDSIRRKSDGKAKIVKIKNRLAKIAFQGTAYEHLSQFCSGECVFIMSDDIVSACKVAYEFESDNKEHIKIISGASLKESLNKDSIVEYAKLPSLEELQSRLLNAINGIGVKLLRTINEAPSSLLRLLNNLEKRG
jgi:large subunit ribosomal protein L10